MHSMESASQWIVLARILRPQGRKGELLADLFTDFPARFGQHPRVWLAPPGFAEAIWNYQLAPAWLIHPAALTLPWLELLCGLALCLGVWTRAAAAWCAALLLVFAGAGLVALRGGMGAGSSMPYGSSFSSR